LVGDAGTSGHEYIYKEAVSGATNNPLPLPFYRERVGVRGFFREHGER
jgi:hypothetical protein